MEMSVREGLGSCEQRSCPRVPSARVALGPQPVGVGQQRVWAEPADV